MRLVGAIAILAAATIVVAGVRLAMADNSTTAPDQQGDVGLYPSMVLDSSGNPVVAYFRSDNGNLKVMHCNDSNCSGNNESKVQADSGGTDSVGINPSLALDHLGYPVVSYYDSTNGDLKVLHCNDPNCVGGNESITTPVSTGDVGFYSSLFIDDIHHPKIAFIDSDTDQVKLLSCNDDNCAGGNETITLVGTEAQYVSMVPDSSGFPVIAWRNTNPIFDTLWIIHCDDFNCTSWSDETPDPGFGTGLFPSLQLDNFGYPVVSYKATSFANVTLLHCNDPDCSGTGDVVNTPVDTGATGAWSSLELDGAGNPVISYHNESNRTLDVVHCNDPNCAGSGDSVTSPDPDTDEIGLHTSLELDAAGNPVVAHYNATQGNLKVLHCDNPDCDPPATFTPIATPSPTPSATPTRSPTPTPTPLGQTPTPTPTPTPIGATPTPTLTTTPIGQTLTPTPVGQTPTPTPTPTPVGQTPTPTPVGQTPTPTPVGQTPSPTPVGQTPTPTPVGQTPTPTPVGQTPSPTPVGQTPTPTSSQAELGLVWGDLDCDQLVNPVDALKGLRHDAGLEVSQRDGCPEPGGIIGGRAFGDWDCSGVVDPVDALKDLRYDAGLDVSQNSPCPPIGGSR